MIRMLGLWVLLSIFIGVFITVWRESTGKERWRLTKSLVFAIMCGLVALVMLSFVVILF